MYQHQLPPPSTMLGVRLVGDISGRFIVKRYQRGYRWGKEEVECLLNDICASGNVNYCLQPLVVKRLGNDEWELVDGQQRLTTLFLIIAYLKRSNLKPSVESPFVIEYETREESDRYLLTLDPALAGANIDFFHMHKAYTVIQHWFGVLKTNHRQQVADAIFGALMATVHVIWYEADGEDATDLFTRLNVGRIPLTDAELFKALLLSGSSQISSAGTRAAEIAAQWDGIERDLRNPDMWAFVSSAPADAQPTRIALLLDVLAGADGSAGQRAFATFDSLRARVTASSAQEVWNEVLGLHALLTGWYASHDLYHKIGYLIAVGMPVATLVGLARGVTKRRFEAELDGLIRDELSLSPSEAAELNYETRSSWQKAERLLLLMNVESVRRNRNATERYPFRAHKARSWSLEHIHAQNAQVLNKAEQWREWLRLHRDALTAISVSDEAREATRLVLIRAIDALPSDLQGNAFSKIAGDVSGFFSPPEATGGNRASAVHSLHSISNLALLSAGDNAALSNAAFEVKRQKVIALDREGAYIPVCTRQVFLKYFTGADAQQIHFWSLQDRESYLQAMIGPPDVSGAGAGIVYRYLKPEEREA